MNMLLLALAATLPSGAASAAPVVRLPQSVPALRAGALAAAAASPAASVSAAAVSLTPAAASPAAVLSQAAAPDAAVAAAPASEGERRESAWSQLKRWWRERGMWPEDFPEAQPGIADSIREMNEAELGEGVSRIELSPRYVASYDYNTSGASSERSGSWATVYYRSVSALAKAERSGKLPEMLSGVDAAGRAASYYALYGVDLALVKDEDPIGKSIKALNPALQGRIARVEISPRFVKGYDHSGHGSPTYREGMWAEVYFDGARELSRRRRSGALPERLNGIGEDGVMREYHALYGADSKR